MKIVSGTPSALARCHDVVDRNITSNLEVAQETIWALPAIPQILVLDSNTPAARRTSFATSTGDSRNNQAANVVFTMAQPLARGLWRIYASGSYTANYLVSGGAGLAIELSSPTELIALLLLQPAIATLFFHMNEEIMIDNDVTDLQVRLFGNGVGQIHSYTLGLHANKYV